MNVEREFAAVNRRVQLLIEQRADEALIRLGFDPVAERKQEEAARREAALEAFEQRGREVADHFQLLAEMTVEAMQPLVRFAEGFSGGAR